jgi:hypothetical protein
MGLERLMVRTSIGFGFDSGAVNPQGDPADIVSGLTACRPVGVSVCGSRIINCRKRFRNALAPVIYGECDHVNSFPKLSGTNGLSPVFLQYSMHSACDAWRITDK